MNRERKFKFYYQGKAIPVGSLTFFDDDTMLINDELPSAEGALVDYVGLKDKNGKEIYEGDIVLSSVTQNKYIVFWNIQHAGFSLKLESDERFILNFEYLELEVIGNIYEKDASNLRTYLPQIGRTNNNHGV